MYYFGTVYPPWWRMAQSSWNSFLSQFWPPGASLPKETFVTALFGKSHYFSSPVFFTSQILHSCSRRSKYSEPLPFRHRGWPNWWWPQHSPSGSGLSHPPVLLCFYPSSRTPKHKDWNWVYHFEPQHVFKDFWLLFLRPPTWHIFQRSLSSQAAQWIHPQKRGGSSGPQNNLLQPSTKGAGRGDGLGNIG